MPQSSGLLLRLGACNCHILCNYTWKDDHTRCHTMAHSALADVPGKTCLSHLSLLNRITTVLSDSSGFGLQALTVKAAVEDPVTDRERAMLLIERGRESNNPTTRGQILSQALQKLAALPAIKPPLPTGSATTVLHNRLR